MRLTHSEVCEKERVEQFDMLTNSDDEATTGGVKAGNLEEIPSKFICLICELVLLNPWQLSCCGTIVCRYCWKKGLSDSEPFTCQFCQTAVTKKQGSADRAVDNELNTVEVHCDSCPWNGTYREYLTHRDTSHADLKCPACAERFSSINAWQEHKHERCLNRTVCCDLPGCLAMVKRRDMPEHYLAYEHQIQLLTNILQAFSGTNKAPADPLVRERMAQQFQAYWEYADLFQSALGILTDDKTRLTGEKEQLGTAIQALMSVLDQLRQHERKSEEKLNQLFEMDAQMEREMMILKQPDSTIDVPILDDQATVTCLFTFTQSEGGVILSSKDSHRFRTSKFGYEFLLRVFFTVDIEQPYLSLFLTLCKSEYMNLLPFPFRYNLYIVLWDQSNAHKHLVYKLEPETKGSAFRRPTGEQNEKCALTKFCPLTVLTDRGSSYATNQTFFIRVFVDFLNDGQMPFEVDVDNPRAFSHLKTLAKVDDYAPMD